MVDQALKETYRRFWRLVITFLVVVGIVSALVWSALAEIHHFAEGSVEILLSLLVATFWIIFMIAGLVALVKRLRSL